MNFDIRPFNGIFFWFDDYVYSFWKPHKGHSFKYICSTLHNLSQLHLAF